MTRAISPQERLNLPSPMEKKAKRMIPADSRLQTKVRRVREIV